VKIGVVGAGLMGAEIALVFALGGMPVVLHHQDQAALERALARLATLWPGAPNAASMRPGKGDRHSLASLRRRTSPSWPTAIW
jgi:3-hydroxyacyl-CoA dehydrogenase